jgi:hypothetical protein
LRVYLRQSGESLELQNYVAEIKIRAERRAGELLQEMEKRDGGDATRAGLQGATELSPRLEDLGIDKTQSHRYQTIGNDGIVITMTMPSLRGRLISSPTPRAWTRYPSAPKAPR